MQIKNNKYTIIYIKKITFGLVTNEKKLYKKHLELNNSILPKKNSECSEFMYL